MPGRRVLCTDIPRDVESYLSQGLNTILTWFAIILYVNYDCNFSVSLEDASLQREA